MKIEISNHAKKRMRERFGEFSERTALHAIERGVKRSDTSGSIRRYLDRLYLSHGINPLIFVYSGCVFIYSGVLNNNPGTLVLITIITLPSKYRNVMRNIKNKNNA